ncbi:hypothetical protein ES288_D03G100400v1 [Gossypium darwinii]|uniref:Uncharacterized protein n=1 Tax=Gossypium darwinii TaxID=34276 RepID=A0A5D2D6Y6_GOSDA|nr:hypothetical protein ES288_D03G100400v1 [Gossypium darwinii]
MGGWSDLELRDHPKDAFGIQGSRTDHRTLFNKWNALAVRSQLEWDSNSAPFEILRRVALWRAQYDESCKLCSGGSYCLSLASMVESVGGLRGSGLPCGGCQRFESAYLQLVNLAETKLYDSTQFFRFGSEAVKCRTIDGDSSVAESITSLRSDPSSMGHVESRVNQQGPPCKAKYSWVTDSEVVP